MIQCATTLQQTTVSDFLPSPTCFATWWWAYKAVQLTSEAGALVWQPSWMNPWRYETSEVAHRLIFWETILLYCNISISTWTIHFHLVRENICSGSLLYFFSTSKYNLNQSPLSFSLHVTDQLLVEQVHLCIWLQAQFLPKCSKLWLGKKDSCLRSVSIKNIS